MATTNNTKMKYVSAIYDASITADATIGTNILTTTSAIPKGSIVNEVVLQGLQTFLPAGGSGQITFRLDTTPSINISATMQQPALDALITTPVDFSISDIITDENSPIKVFCQNVPFTQGKVRVIVGYFEPSP